MTQTPPRDKRVDQIGFVGELQRQHADQLKTKVKIGMVGGDVARVEGDYFEGLLVHSEVSTVDPEQWLRLYERRELTRPQFLAALSVRKEPAGLYLGRRDLAAISTETPATPALRVTRIKGVDLRLLDALKGLSAALATGA